MRVDFIFILFFITIKNVQYENIDKSLFVHSNHDKGK